MPEWKLTVEQGVMLTLKRREGRTLESLAREFGVNNSTAHRYVKIYEPLIREQEEIARELSANLDQLVSEGRIIVGENGLYLITPEQPAVAETLPNTIPFSSTG